jgi:hypothetical protein
MNAGSRIAIALLAVALSQAQAAQISCHIHLLPAHPAAGGKPVIIQNVGDQRRCEQLNAERYDGQGRCHCTFSARPGQGDRPADGVDTPAGPPPGLP